MLATDLPLGPLCYLPSRTVTEPRGDGTAEGTKRGPGSKEGSGERCGSLEILGLLAPS